MTLSWAAPAMPWAVKQPQILLARLETSGPINIGILAGRYV